MGPRHPTLRGARRRAHPHALRNLGATAAGLVVVAGALTISGVSDIGTAPAADTVLSCTDTWTGGAGTTDWGSAGNWSAGVPDGIGADACLTGGATVVDQNAAIVVGELTVATGSSLTVGTGSTPATGSAGATLTVTSGLDNDGTLTAGASTPGAATLVLGGPITNTGNFEVFGTLTVGNAAPSNLTNTGTVGIAPGGAIDLQNASTLSNASNGLLAFGISGPPTSASNYGRILNGSLALDGSVAPVFEGGGFTPSPRVGYVVANSSFSGTFATVRDGATVDYSHPDALGLVGGAPASTTETAITSTAPTSVFGQVVGLTVTVTPSSASGPTGSVSFADGGVLLGSTPVVTAAGTTTATLDVSDLPVGTQPVAATYSGDVLFGSSVSPVDVQVVHPDNANVTIAAAPSNAVPGQQVVYTVSVTAGAAGASGAGQAAGFVSLTDDGSPIPGCQSLALSTTNPPQVTCSETYDADATHSVVAAYSGSPDFLPSTAAVTETVAPQPTTTSLTASARTSTTGAAVSFTAAVAANGGTAEPTGSVTFTDDGTPIGTSTLTTEGGTATTSMLLTTLPLGVNSITASYGGDPGFGASASGAVLVTVDRAPTELSLGSSVDPSTSGQPVIFTASVFPATGSGETGTVTFSYQGTVIGRASVSNGQAAITTATLPVGTGSVTASYAGDGNFVGSATPSAWSQEVDPAPG
ncbi:MAG TPA: Ig-like domain-containing protein [Acidimicrobiales bacterium]